MKYKGERKVAQVSNHTKRHTILIFVAAITVGIVGQNDIVAQAQLPAIEQPIILETEDLSTPKPWQNVQLIHTLEGHTAAIDALVFSSDSTMLISGGSYNDPLMRFWWLKTGKEIEHLRAQRTAVGTIVISPDGETLVSSGDDAGINLWDWESGKYTATFLEHQSNILALAISPDSEILVSGGLDGIRVWSLKPQRPLYPLIGVGNSTYSLAFNPNGYILASGEKEGQVKFWNLRTAQLISEFLPHNQEISGVAFTPDGKTLVTASYDRTIKVWDLKQRKLKYVLIGHTDKIRGIALHPDGETLASASNDGVRLWNLNTGELLNHIGDHNDWVESVAFSPDGKILATGGFDFTIKLWQSTLVETNQELVPKEEKTEKKNRS